MSKECRGVRGLLLCVLIDWHAYRNRATLPLLRRK
jgi:hypothetical protein